MSLDWRLVNQEQYLKGKRVVKEKFNVSTNCDHAHCSFCWGKFGIQTEMLHFGFRVVDGPWWICEKCFDDFKEQFNWDIVK